MPAYEIDGVVPIVHPGAFVHPDAILIGDVIVGDRVYIGPAASLRGDFGSVVVEDGANIQDCAVLHSYPGREVRVGADALIAHSVVLHGCTIHRDALVGIRAVVMDDAIVGERSFVAVCSFVPANMEIPPDHLALGTPARVLRPLTEAELGWKANGTRMCNQLAMRSATTMRKVEPLTNVAERKATLPLGLADSTPLHQLKNN